MKRPKPDVTEFAAGGDEVERADSASLGRPAKNALILAFLLLSTATALLGWAAWNAFRGHYMANALEGEIIRVELLGRDLRHLDEGVTMSAHLAVLTGDDFWFRRTERLTAELTATLDLAVASRTVSVGSQLAGSLRRATEETIQLRSEAIELFSNGRRSEAEALLLGPAYQNSRELFQSRAGELIQRLRQSASSLVDEERQQSFRSLQILPTVSLVLVLSIGLLLVQLKRRRDERDRAEAGKDDSDRQLSAVFDTVGDGIVVVDSDSSILIINQEVGRIWNCLADELVGAPISKIVPALKPHARLPVREPFEADGVRSDGTSFPVELRITHTRSGNKDLWIAAIQDISERRKIEAELERHRSSLMELVKERTCELERANLRLESEIQGREEAERRAKNSVIQLHQIAENINSTFWLIEPENESIIYVSPSSERILGLPVADLMADSRSWLQVVHDEDRETVAKAFTEALSSGLFDEEYRIRGNEPGQLRWLRDRSFPLTDEDGKICRVARMTEDVTEKKMLWATRRQAQKLEAVGQLAAGIAHEINTPTQYIGDNVSFLKDSFGLILEHIVSYRQWFVSGRSVSASTEEREKMKEFVEDGKIDYIVGQIPAAISETLEGVERVSSIVRAMKEFAHPGGTTLTEIDIHSAIESTFAVARNEWKYVADVATDLDPDMPPVPCIPGEFNQMILNIIVNAAHAIGDVIEESGEGGKGLITLTTKAADGFATIKISDTGGGIPESVRNLIFDPFFTTKEVGKGSGQGLSIARASIVKMGGSLDFVTVEGEGTTFVIRLPLVAAGDSKAGRAA